MGGCCISFIDCINLGINLFKAPAAIDLNTQI